MSRKIQSLIGICWWGWRWICWHNFNIIRASTAMWRSGIDRYTRSIPQRHRNFASLPWKLATRALDITKLKIKSNSRLKNWFDLPGPMWWGMCCWFWGCPTLDGDASTWWIWDKLLRVEFIWAFSKCGELGVRMEGNSGTAETPKCKQVLDKQL